MQVCLNCAREEYDHKLTECRICGGGLWVPTHVGGEFGNRDIEEAKRLILAGQKPWTKPNT